MRIIEWPEDGDPPKMLRLRAVRGPEIVGQLTATERGLNSWYLSTLYSEQFHQGIGSSLMAEFLRRVGDGADVRAYAHPAAVALNRRFGFVDVKEGQNEFGQIHMARFPTT